MGVASVRGDGAGVDSQAAAADLRSGKGALAVRSGTGLGLGNSIEGYLARGSWCVGPEAIRQALRLA